MKRFSYRAKVCGRYFFQFLFVPLFLFFLFPLGTFAAPTLGDGSTKTTLGNDIIGSSKFIYSLGGLSIGTSQTSAGSLLVTGNVGIGTTSPSNALHVVSGNWDTFKIEKTGANAGSFVFGFDSKGAVLQNLTTGKGMWFYDNAANVFGMAYGGNVGIGTTDSTNYKLTLQGGSGGSLRWGNGAQGGMTYDTGKAIIYGLTGNDLSFGAGNSFDQLYIKSGGNVGIATTTPQAKLDVNGLIKMRSATITQPEDVVNRGFADSAYAPIGGTSQWSTTSTGIYYNSGNVGIGTIAPARNLSVNGVIGLNDSGGTERFGISATSGGIDSHMKDAGGTSVVRFDTRSGGLSYINTGNVGIGTTNPTSILAVGAGGDGSSTRTTITVNNAGYAAPSAINTTSVGDKFVFWNSSSYKGDIGLNTGEMFFQSQGTGSNGKMSFYTGASGDGPAMVISRDRNIGIGTTAPGGKLHSYLGASGASPYQSDTNGLIIENSGRATLQFLTPNTQDQYVMFGDPQSGNVGWLSYTHSADLMRLKSGGDIDFYGAGILMTIKNNGKVGIATTTPGSPLTVSPASGISADMATGRIQNVGTPVNAGDAVNKGYVESTLFSMPPEDNLLTNGDFETGDIKGWAKWGGLTFGVTTGGYAGNYTAQITGDTNILSSDFIPVDPTKDVFQLEAYVKKSVQGSTPGILYFGYVAYNASYGVITSAPCGFYCYFAASGWTIPNDGNWHKVSATTYGEGTSYPNFPVGTKFVKVLGLINYLGSSDTVTLVDHVRLKRINYGPLFVGNNFSRTNYVDQYQNSKIYTTAANNLILEPPTNGNVGIGTADPGYKLDIHSASNAVPIVFHIGTAGVATHGIYLTPYGTSHSYNTITVGVSEDLRFQTGGVSSPADRLTILTGGNVGIATTTPQSTLDVNGLIKMRSALITQPEDVVNKAYLDSAFTSSTPGGVLPIGTSGQTIRHNGTGWIANSLLYNDGTNVGIGTTNPGKKLEVAGDTLITTTSSSQPFKTNQATYQNFSIDYPSSPSIYTTQINFGLLGRLQYDGNGGVMNIENRSTQAGSIMRFVMGTTERLRITDTGNVGIGTTNPTTKLDIVKGSASSAPTLGTPSGTLSLGGQSDNWGLDVGIESSGNSWLQAHRFDGTGTAYNLNFQPSGGNVGIATTTPQSKLDVNGLIKMRNATITQPEDVVNKSYVDSMFTGSGQWTTNGSYVYLTSTTQSVGIGTSVPGAKLAIHQIGVANTPLTLIQAFNMIPYSAGNGLGAARIEIGHGILHGYIEGAANSETNSADGYMAFGTRRPANNVIEAMRINSAGNVGIATTTPQSTLDVNGLIKMRSATITQPEDVVNKSYIDSIVGFSTSSALYVLKGGDTMTGTLIMSGANINMNGNNITGANKISVAAIDPLYSIGGVKYSTYAGSFVGGVKEEFVGKARLVRKEDTWYEYTINFNTVKKGSDLWIWYKAIDFSRDNIEVLATAYKIPISIAYEIKNNQIIFSAECGSKKCANEIEISYRLIGKRFDWRNWPTYAKDQSEEPNLIVE